MRTKRESKGEREDMDDKLLINLSHLLANFRAMDVIANNLANASTPGYKREAVQFSEFLKQMPPSEGESQPELISLVKDAGVVRDITQGRLDMTGAPLDLAISGKGYFVVQTPAGDRYTRNGHFDVDNQGRLITSEGGTVMAEGGQIAISPDDGDVHVAGDGTVSGKKGPIGKIRVVGFPDERRLKKEGASLYSTDQTPSAASGAIAQGAIEASNVEPVIEIARMIEVIRAYEATASMMKPQAGETEEMDRLGAMPKV